jgi:TatD DNase family protein
MMLVDSHCHLDFPDFETDREEVIARATNAGVGILVTISTRVRQFDRLRRIIETHPNVFASIGTHPHNAAEEPEVTTADLIRLAEHPKVVAIGEAGLDYHYDNSPREAQAEGFRRHIAAARETGLPIVIHARDADDDIAAILREEAAKGSFPGILHCYTSGAALAKTGIELGLHVAFSGIITFKKTEALRAIAAEVPADRLLVETDAPYLAPTPHRGGRNEPAYVVSTARVLAEVRGMTPEALAELTTANFLRLFHKVPVR